MNSMFYIVLYFIILYYYYIVNLVALLYTIIQKMYVLCIL